MGLEIERKFLVNQQVIPLLTSQYKLYDIRQGLLTNSDLGCVRVRVCSNGTSFMTVKSSNIGIKRTEYECEIPQFMGEAMLDTIDIRTVISKTRYAYMSPEDGKTWTIDVFAGRLNGLMLAEIELEYPDEEIFLLPFVDLEVTNDPTYYTINLANDHDPSWLLPSPYTLSTRNRKQLLNL